MLSRLKLILFFALTITFSFSEEVKSLGVGSVSSFAVRSFRKEPIIRMSVYPNQLIEFERYLSSKKLPSDNFSLSILYVQSGNHTISMDLEVEESEFQGFVGHLDRETRSKGERTDFFGAGKKPREDGFKQPLAGTTSNSNGSLSDQNTVSVFIVGLVATTETGDRIVRVFFEEENLEDLVFDSLNCFREGK